MTKSQQQQMAEEIDAQGEAQRVTLPNESPTTPPASPLDKVTLSITGLNDQIIEHKAAMDHLESQNELMLAQIGANKRLIRDHSKELKALREKRELVGVAAMRIALRDQP